MKQTIYWTTKDQTKMSMIREKFNIPTYVTVNGETECDIKDSDIELLRDVERWGYIQIRNKSSR